MNILFFITKCFRRVTIFSFIDQALNFLVFAFNNVPIPRDYETRGVVYLHNNGTVSIGERCKLYSNFKATPIGGDERIIMVVYKGAFLTIGRNVGISNSAIVCHNKIVIEDDVNIGGGCRIYDTDFHSINYEDRVLKGNVNVKSAPVIIRKGVWLGAGVIVIKGVEIGEKSVVAAGAVVTKNIPAGELWGGNPARFIKKVGS